ncbi:hypothetical protein HX776_05110 [Pseudomonas agarici]|uniref:DUF6285 domain-containing protein n=2 Tax=Pseudomonas agarici TaxID=46677 RepID=UPI0008C3A745|nr:DUF6285 domain-containing protein [Pseudomonas agarici]NWC08214.1 hypothetical protein [Pseudomonas agarici]SEK83772.1 hypothetical protein SAMN05216604_10787 [Pseudomonas agarici]
MRDAPDGEQLLITAQALLRDELLPTLAADQRHAGLMIARAMAIAIGQMHNGDRHELEELAVLDTLIPLPGAPELPWRERLREANRQLSLLIRQGFADHGEPRQGVYRHLLDTARHKLRESNPGYRQ